MRVNLRGTSCLPRPPGDEVAGLRSFRPMNRAQEPRLRGGSSVAGALYATAGLVSEHIRHYFHGHLSWVDAHGALPQSKKHTRLW